jgi:hypothetical protein
MRVFGVSFAAAAATAPQDLVELTAHSTARICILGWEIGQSTEAGDAADEQVLLKLISGHATSGSGGSSFTPFAVDSDIAVAALTAAEINNTTVASTGTAVNRHATAFNVRAGHIWLPPPDMRHVIAKSGIVVLRMDSTPADSISFSGTLYFGEY